MEVVKSKNTVSSAQVLRLELTYLPVTEKKNLCTRTTGKSVHEVIVRMQNTIIV